eukprot:TRINITY_DN67430_c0_g1_i1.p1 TRINITY_DN67430_c0_g1~~TRINITY_DN67430_c0_g1_i1.p1  ORF type:complete len:568 (-),score=111.91 TRINITY_DN67430_c0_g1_i1:375-2003(-)
MPAVADASGLLEEARIQMESDPLRSIDLAEASKKLFQESGDARGVRDALRAIAFAKLACGDYETATKILSDGLAAAKLEGDIAGTALMQLTSAEVSLYLGKGDEALQGAQAARESFKTVGDTHRQSSCTIAECHAYFLLEDASQAAVAAEAAKELAEASGDVENVAKAWHILSSAREEMQDNEAAIFASQQACAQYRLRKDEKSEAIMLCALSRQLLLDGKAEAALQAAQKSVDIFTKLGSNKAQIVSWQALACVKSACGEVGEAEAMLQGKWAEFEKSGHRDIAAELMLLAADVNLMVDHFPSALRNAQLAHDVFSALGDVRGQAAAFMKIGSANFLQKRLDEAAENVQKALFLFRKLGLVRDELEAMRGLAAIYTESGEPEKSPLRKEALSCADELVDAVEKRDADAYQNATKKLSKHGGLSDKDLEERLRPLVEKGGNAVRSFLRTNDLISPKPPDSAEEIDPLGHYVTFRSNGLQYGKAFRSVKACWRRGAKGTADTEVLTVLQLHDSADSWEDSVQILHPGIFDSLLQSMTHIGSLS